MAKTAELGSLLAEVRDSGDFDRLVRVIPYARKLGMTVVVEEGELLTRMEGRESMIGNPMLPALHGGTVGALMESAGIFKLLFERDIVSVPKTITLTVDYLRSPRVVETTARARITRFGRRVANVQVQAFQEDRGRPIAAAHAHFLLNS